MLLLQLLLCQDNAAGATGRAAHWEKASAACAAIRVGWQSPVLVMRRFVSVVRLGNGKQHEQQSFSLSTQLHCQVEKGKNCLIACKQSLKVLLICPTLQAAEKSSQMGHSVQTQCSTHMGWLPTAWAAQQQGLNDEEVSCCPVSQCRVPLMALLDVMAITIK